MDLLVRCTKRLFRCLGSIAMWAVPVSLMVSPSCQTTDISSANGPQEGTTAICGGGCLPPCQPPPPKAPRLSIIQMDPPRLDLGARNIAVDLTFKVQNTGTDPFVARSGEANSCPGGSPTGTPSCPPLYSSSAGSLMISPLWSIQFEGFQGIIGSATSLVDGDLGQTDQVFCAGQQQQPQPSGHDVLGVGCIETIHLAGVQAYPPVARAPTTSPATGTVQICAMQGANGGACLSAMMSQCPTDLTWCGENCSSLNADPDNCSSCLPPACVNDACDPPPLRGFVDLHTHPLANLGFGGKLLYGGPDVGSLLPADPDCNHNVRAVSEAHALGHDRSTHGGYDFFSNQCGDLLRGSVIHTIQSSLGGADESDNAIGYPDFSEWPVWNDLTHQKMWVEWIRRLYQHGLRVMVALAVNNKTLGDMTAGPGDFSTDDKTSADLQIAETKSFVGRHADFMEVALSSADVHRIVSANKLAVVIGIEVDHIGNFQTAQAPGLPSDGAVRAEIDRLYGEGVRYMFPIHVLDNAFGGAAVYMNLFNVSNWRESGYPYALVCACSGEDINYVYNNKEIGLQAILGQLIKLGWAAISITYPPCPAAQTCPAGQTPSGQKNSLGLTHSGLVAINEMMRLGMLIDIDHMSQEAADQVLAIAASPQIMYPVNSGHNAPRGTGADNHNERALRVDQYATIGRLHGMAGVGSAGLNGRAWLDRYNGVIKDMGGGNIAAGFGTDTNGFALGMPPDPSLICGSPYSTDGTKTWTAVSHGVAHYGMFADLLDSFQMMGGGSEMLRNFMTGADYFYQTWKIAEAQAKHISTSMSLDQTNPKAGPAPLVPSVSPMGGPNRPD